MIKVNLEKAYVPSTKYAPPLDYFKPKNQLSNENLIILKHKSNPTHGKGKQRRAKNLSAKQFASF